MADNIVENKSTNQNITQEEIEDTIYSLIVDLLGKEIDVEETFLQMGLESMHIYRIYNSLMEIYPSSLEISDIFEYLTIESLANHIVTILN